MYDAAKLGSQRGKPKRSKLAARLTTMRAAGAFKKGRGKKAC